MIDVSAISASSPAFAVEHWHSLAGEDLSTRLSTRAIALAHADTLENPLFVCSAWSTHRSRLRGLAIAVVEQHEGNRAVLVVTAPATHQRAHCPGLWIGDGENPEEVATDLLSTLAAHAHRSGIDRLVVAHCLPDDDSLRVAVEHLGGRAIPAPPDHQIRLAPGTSFETFLAALGRARRQSFTRDLRQYAALGAQIVEETPPSLRTCEESSPLLRESFARKGSRLCFEGDVLRALNGYLPAGAFSILRCMTDERLVGFLAVGRHPRVTELIFIGRVADPPLHVASALFATSIRAEILRGADTILLGPTNDRLKLRLGSVALPRVHYFIRTAGRA